MRTNPTDYLHAIYALRYVTVETLTIENDTPNAKYHITNFLRSGLVEEIFQYGKEEKIGNDRSMDRKVYAVTDKYCKFEGLKRIKIPEEKSFEDFKHQVQVANSVMGIYWHYRHEYEISVEYEKTFRLKNGKSVRCDALIKMQNIKTALRYDFILEQERTKTPTEVVKKKILAKWEFRKQFQEYGLSHNTKIIFVKSSKYNLPGHEDILIGEILADVKGLSDCYRFAKYQDWRNFNKGVWFMPNRSKVNLIN